MLRQTWSEWLGQLNRHLLRSRQAPTVNRRRPQLESLCERLTPAVSAILSFGTLSVLGDAQDNSIDISRDVNGNLLVNGGAVTIQGGTATIQNTKQLVVFAGDGNDTVTINQANGLVLPAVLYGGNGNDVLNGGAGNDKLYGQNGKDSLFGAGGNDLLYGGADDDRLEGGDAFDQVFGEGGNDLLVWNPGDDSDLNEGGADNDTVEVNGSGVDESFSASPNGTRVRFERTVPSTFVLDIGSVESLVLNANGGNDNFAASGNLAPLIRFTIDGGDGNDTLIGSNGPDTILGGNGLDLVVGMQGDDKIGLGADDDVFQWNPGDGSDLVEGNSGSDKMIFFGSNASEQIDVSSNVDRVRFFRDVGNITMDLHEIESVDFVALGGADSVTINPLNGTDLAEINLNLTSPNSGGDGAADRIVVQGTNAADVIDVFETATGVSVMGLATTVNISNAEANNDDLFINALGGGDTVNATGLPANVIGLNIDGGSGNDILLGSAGDDFIVGGQGTDTALMGAGNDIFQWAPGDGSDVLEGQAGTDEMIFLGANVSESFDVSAVGNRVRFFRNVASIVMDLNDVEILDVRALGGADSITINDLSGTDVTDIQLDLGASDGAADTVTVNGTNGDDVIVATGDASGVAVLGLAALIQITGAESANDRLVINALAGDDIVEASGLTANSIRFTASGGQGDDVLVGGDGNDTLLGGEDDDVLLGGPGTDVLDGGLGNNVIVQ